MSVEPIEAYLKPLRKSVSVARPADEAFAVFTRDVGRWWPLARYSVSEGRARSCVLEGRVGGRFYEVRDDGATFTWGEVRVWEPPHRILFSWHPGREPETAQEVELRFTPVGAGTLVELEHRGWAVLGEKARELRAGYDGGWETVLGRHFANACAGRDR